MTFVGQCFGAISSCFYGTGEWKPSPTVPILPVIPDVILDTSCMGKCSLPYGTYSLYSEMLSVLMFVIN